MTVKAFTWILLASILNLVDREKKKRKSEEDLGDEKVDEKVASEEEREVVNENVDEKKVSKEREVVNEKVVNGK